MPSCALFCFPFIVMFKLKAISGTNKDYWSDTFDHSQKCEHKGRRQIFGAVACVPQIMSKIL